MENKKYTSAELNALYTKGEITFVEVVRNLDPVISKEYDIYCEFHKLDNTSDDVAHKFFDEELFKSLEEKGEEYGYDVETIVNDLIYGDN